MSPDQQDDTAEQLPTDAANDTTDFTLRSDEPEPGMDVLDDEAPPPKGTDVLPELPPEPVAEEPQSGYRGSRPPREEDVRAWEHKLPIKGYGHLTIQQVVEKARSLSPEEVKRVREFEAKNRNRKTLLAKLDRIAEGGQEA